MNKCLYDIINKKRNSYSSIIMEKRYIKALIYDIKNT